MVILAVVSVPISFMNISNKFTILNIMNDVHYQATFSAEQLQTQVMFYLNQYESGILLISLFGVYGFSHLDILFTNPIFT